jgi:hypothetical protein
MSAIDTRLSKMEGDMKLSFQIESRFLVGMYALAAKKTKQTPHKELFLDSVYIRLTPDSVVLVGRSPAFIGMCLCKERVDGFKDEGSFEANIPGLLAGQVKVKKGVPGLFVDIETKDHKHGHCRIVSADGHLDGMLDAPHTPPLHFFPKKVSGVPAQFNVDFLATLKKASRILNGYDSASFTLGHNGADAALIDMGIENFTGIIMPVSIPSPVSPPDWALELCGFNMKDKK